MSAEANGRPQGTAVGLAGGAIASRQSTCLIAALRYAAADWPVFPCQPGSKVPFPRSNGVKDATTDPDTITDWWSRCPTANVAIATGGSAPDVLDFDVKKGAPGRQSYERLRDAGLLTGAHAVVGTPSGGWHLYYLGSDQGNASLPRHGVDLRSRGGYVLAPPSLVDGLPYGLAEWRSRYDGYARGLDFTAIRRYLDPPRPPRQIQPGTGGDHGALVRHVAGQQEGNRNGALYWAACRAAEKGAGDDVFAQLLDAAMATGLPGRDAEKTIASARRTGVPA